MDQVRQIAYDTLLDDLESGDIDRMEMKSHIRDSISKFLYAKTKRKPMILPVIMNV
jgi:ribonuclease J